MKIKNVYSYYQQLRKLVSKILMMVLLCAVVILWDNAEQQLYQYAVQ